MAMVWLGFKVPIENKQIENYEEEKKVLLNVLEQYKEEKEDIDVDVYSDGVYHVSFDEEFYRYYDDISTRLIDLNVDFDCNYSRFGRDTEEIKFRNGKLYTMDVHPEYDEPYVYLSQIDEVIKNSKGNDEIRAKLEEWLKPYREFKQLTKID